MAEGVVFPFPSLPLNEGRTYGHILKIQNKVKQDSFTIVPLEVFLSHGFAKIEIGLAKGKKLHDKREDIARKDQKREMDRASKIRY